MKKEREIERIVESRNFKNGWRVYFKGEINHHYLPTSLELKDELAAYKFVVENPNRLR